MRDTRLATELAVRVCTYTFVLSRDIRQLLVEAVQLQI
jgi:hypothetical protein